MWRWTRRLLMALVCLVPCVALCGATYDMFATRRALAATPPPGRLVDIGGHRLHVWCAGSGAPLVVLEAGLGGSFDTWGFVQPEVARFTRVCSYDRAGQGYSDPGPTPRTSGRIAREMGEWLNRMGATEPLVLVGASSGGFSMRLFATQHPERVKGLVLVDASHEDQRHEVPPIARFVPLLASIGAFRVLGISFGMNPDSLPAPVRAYARATRFRAAGYKAAADEIAHIQQSADEVRETRRPLPHPVIVISGGRGADDTWRALQRDQVTLSPRGCQIVAEDSGHVVPLQQPQVIVDALRVLVAAAREGSAAPACDSVGTR